MKRYLLMLAAVFAALGADAQELVVGAGFETRFDNREYSGNTYDRSQTLFSARLTPRVGVEWSGHNRLIFGVDLLQNFGQNDRFLSEAKPLMYYRFKNEHVKAAAGIFDRRELDGDYPLAMVSDSMKFYENRISGLMGQYRSSRREDTFVELSLDWVGIKSGHSRERFRILSAGRYSFGRCFYFGYAFSLFHFANSDFDDDVADNMMLVPNIGTKFSALFDFEIEAGAILAPQRLRMLGKGWTTPKGGELRFKMSWHGIMLENRLYAGQGLMPCYGVYGGELYAGERFYSTDRTVYNRTELGYKGRFFNKTLEVEAGILFHYDGTGLGTSQVIRLGVDIERLFKIGGRKN